MTTLEILFRPPKQAIFPELRETPQALDNEQLTRDFKIIQKGFCAEEHLNDSNLNQEEKERLSADLDLARQTMSNVHRDNVKFFHLVINRVYKQYRNLCRYKGLERDELQGVAYLGFVKGCRHFDPDKGAFTTYFDWWATQELKNYIEGEGLIPIPRRTSEFIYRVNKTEAQLTSELKRQPLTAEVAKAANISEEKMRRELSLIGTKSLNTPLRRDSDTTFLELIPSPHASVEAIVANRIFISQLEKLISTLPATKATIVDMYLCSNNNPGISFREIAKLVGFSSEKVRMLFVEAINEIKPQLLDILNRPNNVK